MRMSSCKFIQSLVCRIIGAVVSVLFYTIFFFLGWLSACRPRRYVGPFPNTIHTTYNKTHSDSDIVRQQGSERRQPKSWNYFYLLPEVYFAKFF